MPDDYWSGSASDLLSELIGSPGDSYDVLNPYYMAQIYADMFGGGSVNPLTGEDLMGSSGWYSDVQLGGELGTQEGEWYESCDWVGDPWSGFEYQCLDLQGASSFTMGEEGTYQFDMEDWLDTYGMYIPEFNPDDLRRLQEDAAFSKDLVVSDVLRQGGPQQSYGEVFGYDDDQNKLKLSSALATSRLKDFQTIQETSDLVSAYESDLFSQIEYLAGTGAFDFMEEQEWTEESVCIPWTGEGC